MSLDTIRYFNDADGKTLFDAVSSMVPPEDSLITFKDKPYIVIGVAFIAFPTDKKDDAFMRVSCIVSCRPFFRK